MNTASPRLPIDAEPSRPGVGIAWLVRVRWLAAAAQLVGLLALRLSGAGSFPPAVFAVPFAVALTNLPAGRWAARLGFDRVATALLAFDTVLLTLFLGGTGGVLNPFTIFYLVQITLSALVLRSPATWGIAILSAAGFGSLFFAFSGSDSPQAQHLRLMMADHLRGMWIAFLSAATATAAFVTALRAALERRERELRQVRAERDRNERLAALSALVGGAAHELATPLATIGVIVGELRRNLGADARPEVAEDLDVVGEELGRCRAILDEMAAGAGEDPGEGLAVLSVGALLAASVGRLEPDKRARVRIADEAAGARLRIPVRAVARSLESLLRNAFDASPDVAPVVLRAEAAAASVRFEVVDRGSGLDEESLGRAGEPFYSTKGTGKGLGLGLFVARTLAEQLGGGLALARAEGGGTRATLTLPTFAEADV